MDDTTVSKAVFAEEKLLSYGFRRENGYFVLSRNIAHGELTAIFSVFDGKLTHKVYDSFDGVEYTLHLSANADGAFVNLVRCELDSIHSEIISNCSHNKRHTSHQTEEVIKYCFNKYGDSFEYLWDNSPDAAAVRRADNRKWYGVLMKISSEKLGILPLRDVNVINLHVDTENIPSLTEKDGIFPAYHMSKKHWITVILDGSVKTDELNSMIDRSYELGGKKKGKMQK